MNLNGRFRTLKVIHRTVAELKCDLIVRGFTEDENCIEYPRYWIKNNNNDSVLEVLFFNKKMRFLIDGVFHKEIIHTDFLVCYKNVLYILERFNNFKKTIYININTIMDIQNAIKDIDPIVLVNYEDHYEDMPLFSDKLLPFAGAVEAYEKLSKFYNIRFFYNQNLKYKNMIYISSFRRKWFTRHFGRISTYQMVKEIGDSCCFLIDVNPSIENCKFDYELIINNDWEAITDHLLNKIIN